MATFLEELAAELYGRYGDGVSSLHILFPSRRAQRFFADALASIADRPLWQPVYETPDSIMSALAGTRAADRIRLIAELFGIYVKFHPEESFDDFYFWGELLLADFDSVDKYLIDADMLFANIADLKELESDVSYLTPEQREVVARFWGAVGENVDNAEVKRRFVSIWETLGPIYHRFRERLDELGIAYSGMLYRRVAERIESGEVPPLDGERYVVAGFNALSECEKRLFKYMRNTVPTEFYWDYDTYYADDRAQEAGLFIRDNLKLFPQASPLGGGYDNFRRTKELTAVSTVSNAVQCKYAGSWLKGLNGRLGGGPEGDGTLKLDKETAVVLTDESLLMPLLYSLPEEIDKINITMGYPLRQTIAYSFLERLVALQGHAKSRTSRSGEMRTVFYHADVAGLLSHPFVTEACGVRAAELAAWLVRRKQPYVDGRRLEGEPILELIFRPCGDWRTMSDYLLDVLSEVARTPYDGTDAARRMEYVSVIAGQLRQLRESLEACNIDFDLRVYASLLRRMLQNVRIPFEGEPLAGVQIMGILETRNIDFKNVIILSMNDDTFPGNRAASSSFIPYNLRVAYGLPTPVHHEGVYAYYFYRLLQRAERVQMVYSARADDKSTGEQSRYIYQLDYESPHKVSRIDVGVDVSLSPGESFEVAKSGRVAEQLERFLDPEGPKLYPTSFYAYVQCPLKFYFRTVARLEESETVSEEIDAPMFGTILHKAMELLYRNVEGQPSAVGGLRRIAGTGAVDEAVRSAIASEYLGGEADEEEFDGQLIFIHDIVCRYIERGLLPYDIGHGDFRVAELEKNIGCAFPVDGVGEVRFGGKADRLDRLPDGTVRVVDYKTGAYHIEFGGVEALFEPDARGTSSAAFQTMLYSMMIYRSEGTDVLPALYYARNMCGGDYSPLLVDKLRGGEVRDYISYRDEFEERLAGILAELFDRSVPFVQCADRKTCEYCDFRNICNR